MPKKYSKKRMISFREKVYSARRYDISRFAKTCYKIVKRIPPGKVLTYKQVAKLAGSPQAFRAVGNALNKNPDLGTIPCHRVIKSDGRSGGYRYGEKRKISLLEKEGIKIKNNRVIKN